MRNDNLQQENVNAATNNKECNEIERMTKIYNEALLIMSSANSKESFQSAASMFGSIPNFKDSEALAEQCLKWAEEYNIPENAKVEKPRKKRNKFLVIGLPLIAVCVVIAILLITVGLPLLKKNSYIKKHGQQAYDLFGIVEEGKYITFGSYEQDNVSVNGAEPIEWLVVKMYDDKALVISKYVLDYRPIHSSKTYSSWDKSGLRDWLNNSFFKNAFSSKQQKGILTTVNAPEDEHGKDSSDKVFLLSQSEANTLLNNDITGRATAYCIAQGAQVWNKDMTLWWLRSIDYAGGKAGLVNIDGSIGPRGINYDGGVRPAMYIDLGAGLSGN